MQWLGNPCALRESRIWLINPPLNWDKEGPYSYCWWLYVGATCLERLEQQQWSECSKVTHHGTLKSTPGKCLLCHSCQSSRTGQKLVVRYLLWPSYYPNSLLKKYIPAYHVTLYYTVQTHRTMFVLRNQVDKRSFCQSLIRPVTWDVSIHSSRPVL